MTTHGTSLPPAPPPQLVHVLPAREKGVGVFAAMPIPAGATVARDFAVVLDKAACDAIASTVLDQYYFAHPEDETAGLMVMGPSALCNHDDIPNVETVTAHDGQIGWFVCLVAARPIAAGEEITRRYACPLWFEPAA